MSVLHKMRYQDEKEIRAVVEGFENCTTPKAAFTHREHLTVAAWYLLKSFNTEDALNKMRSGLLNFLNHYGLGEAKYKEQITRDWMALAQETIEGVDGTTVEIVNLVIDRLGSARLN